MSITNYTTASIKYKCKHCGKIEYWSTMLFSTPAGGVCKKGIKTAVGRGHHQWIKVDVVQNPPKKRK